MLSLMYWHAHMLSSRVRKHWRVLDRFRTLDPRQAQAETGRRLLQQVRYFGNREDALPEWREAASIRDPSDLLRVWSDLPILSKEDLRIRFSPAEIRSRCGVQGMDSSTGGSTGEPTPFLHDQAMLRALHAAKLYCHHRMGWRPGMPLVCVWGSERDIGRTYRLRSRIAARLRNRYLIDGYRLNSQTADRVFAVLNRPGDVAIYGFTSMLEFVARELLARRDILLRGRVRAAWNGGEMLYDSQSVIFEQAFGVPILNLYGGRELGAMAFQRSVGTSLEVLRPYVFVEIVDEAGRPVPPGETGRLIWTSTLCRGTPFVRYDVGDLGIVAAGDQDESGIRRLSSLQGRYAGLLQLPDGKTINNLFWNHLMKEFPEVVQFQVALRESRGIELRLKGRAFRREREMQLRRVLLNMLGPLPVSIVWLDSIPLTSQGKLLQVVREAA